MTFEEAIQEARWRLAMDEKMKAIKRNDTWQLATLPKGKQFVEVKWIFKVKKNARGEVEEYKARLVAKRFTQRVVIDYDEVFGPIAHL